MFVLFFVVVFLFYVRYYVVRLILCGRWLLRERMRQEQRTAVTQLLPIHDECQSLMAQDGLPVLHSLSL